MAEATGDNSFHVEQRNCNYCLKESHNRGYYGQVRGQLALTGLKWCGFVVFLSVSNEMNIERTYFDHAFPFIVNRF